MSDFIAFLLYLMGQPPQQPTNPNLEPEISTRSGGIPIQPNQQPQVPPQG